MKIGDLIKVTFWRSAAEANKDPHYFTNAVDESMGIIVNEAQDPYDGETGFVVYLFKTETKRFFKKDWLFPFQSD